MYYLNKFKKLDAQQKIKFFIDLCNNPLEVQKNVLQEILKINENCEIGKKLNFSSIKTIKEYQKNIPVSSWKDYEKYSKKMERGEENILFSGKTEYFTITSGTTGKNKLIPESEYGSQIKHFIGHLRDNRILSFYPDAVKGKVLSMANHVGLYFTEAGIPIGSASGITTANTDEKFLKILSAPVEIKEIEDFEAADYALMRFSIEKDVRAIAGNNAGRIPLLIEIAQKYADEIIKDIEYGTISSKFEISDEIREKLKPYLKPNKERADELKKELEICQKFLPQIYWKNLKLIKCWLSGSVGQYVKTLEPYLKGYDDIIFFDAGYGASEGKFNLPLKPNTTYAPVAHFSAFYEFLPLNSDNYDNLLMLNELEDGKEYKLIITTYSGLYRYDMKDIIKVNGFTGNTPNIAFVSKTSDIANIAGEKLDIKLLYNTCSTALSKHKLKLVHFCVVPDSDNLRHNFYMEIENMEKLSSKIIQEEMEDYLMKNNIVYRTFREQNLIQALQISFMKKGWQNALYKEQEKKGLTRSQIKLPLVYTKLPMAEYKI